MKARIVPDNHLCHKHGLQPRVRVEANPNDPRVTSKIAIVVTLACACERYYGVEKAWINSNLEMCVSGGFVNPQNKLVKKWRLAPND